MRYFRLFDELTGPDGDVYRWNGKSMQMRSSRDGTWGFEHGPMMGETAEGFLEFLVGPTGRWEEIQCPES